jgi:hypothetical protein
MPTLFGEEWTRERLLDYVGDMSQVAGARRTQTVEGAERGADQISLWNGSGLELGLLPGRCLDIASARFNGMSLCYRSHTGDVGPAFFDSYGDGWLRSFYGGLVITCGLSYLGHTATDPEEENRELGLHGRIAAAPAGQVAVESWWEGDDYVVEARGRMRETIVFGVNLELRRRIRMTLGQPSFTIHDEVENLSRTVRSPLMVVYHTNPGFPFLREGARLLLRSRLTTESSEGRAVGPDVYASVGPPATPTDEVFVHDLTPDAEGQVRVALVNDHLAGGLGVYWRYPKAELPVLNQWLHFEAGTYVMGVEPGNCSVMGRQANREAGTLQHLAPGETRRFTLEMGVLEGAEAIARFEQEL